MGNEKHGTTTRDDGWRLEPRERLFATHEREGKATPAEVASDAMLRCLAEGRTPDSERQVAFANLLVDATLGDDIDPLSGFAHLYDALQADYAYSDADHHLEGYAEGMLYGMLRLAELIVEELDSRGESFLPASVLTHPDALLASCLSQTMSASRISELLGIPVQEVIKAVVDLGQERIVIQSICGRSRFFFPSRRGEEFAKRLRKMVQDAAEGVGNDPVDVTDALMRMADFPEWEAAHRAVSLLARETGLLDAESESEPVLADDARIPEAGTADDAPEPRQDAEEGADEGDETP